MPPGALPDKTDPNIGTASTTRIPTALSPTSPKRPASPACRRIATAWAWRSAISITTASKTSTSPDYGGNTLYRNNGDGTFTDVTARAGVAAGGWSTSAGFFDYDNDGKLDMFVARYLEWSFDDNRFCGERNAGRPSLLPSR